MRFALLMAEEGHFDKWEVADVSLRETVRPGADRPVTDGPFAETVEQIGGFYVIDVDSIDVAVELAALLPREYTIEVRPVLEVEL